MTQNQIRLAQMDDVELDQVVGGFGNVEVNTGQKPAMNEKEKTTVGGGVIYKSTTDKYSDKVADDRATQGACDKANKHWLWGVDQQKSAECFLKNRR